MKLLVKETSYTVKPKQTEGKLVVRSDRYSTKPKQTEGKICILREGFTIKPKPDGIKMYRTKTRSVAKLDARIGVKVYEKVYDSVLKRDTRNGVRLYRADNTRVLKQTCDGTIFTWDATASVFRPQTSNLSGSVAAGISTLLASNLLSRIYATERPIVMGITWSNTISGGTGGVNFPDGTYPETASFIYYAAEIRKTPTAVDNSTGSVFQSLIGLTGMDGSTGVTFSFDSAAGNYWFRFQGGFTGSTFKPSGTKAIRDFTLRNVSDGNALLGRCVFGFRVT